MARVLQTDGAAPWCCAWLPLPVPLGGMPRPGRPFAGQVTERPNVPGGNQQIGVRPGRNGRVQAWRGCPSSVTAAGGAAVMAPSNHAADVGSVTKPASRRGKGASIKMNRSSRRNRDAAATLRPVKLPLTGGGPLRRTLCHLGPGPASISGWKAGTSCGADSAWHGDHPHDTQRPRPVPDQPPRAFIRTR